MLNDGVDCKTDGFIASLEGSCRQGLVCRVLSSGAGRAFLFILPILNPILLESASSSAKLPSVALMQNEPTEERSDELANSAESKYSMSNIKACIPHLEITLVACCHPKCSLPASNRDSSAALLTIS